ncbi:glyoxylase-like metal-dependent hydrolase (beta-lactamase superfamily II) [Paraburkholderia sp. BL6669N2]|uniref:MBL fold metallo-hydrolase n=1 Tax=Paraburkholderia sp. BL6669N2 TaxID=1938807 RepID=UPI000E398B0B|nr:MBL fold metallo-hydrolase [Paraburkholderia sp. BL6669N2]REG49585.1 glyoxylase-like metal-dependent hydrolase (beta-lactamase superfamily II) [Paraburkholderia sp. BL6669N2]
MTSKAAEMASEEAEAKTITPNFHCAGSGGLFAAVPVASRGKPPGPEGFVLEEIKPDIFWISAGGYDTIFMPTGDGVIVVDAPPALGPHMLNAIRAKTEEPIKYVVYSHSHFDHIGAANLYPDSAIRIAHSSTADLLARYADSHRPVPNIVFKDEYVLEVGGRKLELRYHGNIHQPGNIFIYEAAQRVLMLVDVIFPGWVPFRNLAVANDVHEFIKAHETVLAYDFDVMVCGHLTRPGTRADVEAQREYVQNLRAASKNALATVKIEDVGSRTGFDNLWALMDGYLNDMIEMATRTVLTVSTSDGRLWSERLAGADVWTKHHAFSMIQALRVENPD